MPKAYTNLDSLNNIFIEMKINRWDPVDIGIKSVGFIELALGASTILSAAIFRFSGISQKPLSIFITVMTAALISMVLGCGILA